jgi:RNA polymerase sigma-70 factor, ECF subfamily
MRRIQAGDEAAFGQLFDRYTNLVYSVALRVLRDAAAAEDVLQEVFYTVWGRAEQFDAARGSLAGWLLVAARNRAISRLRGRPAVSLEAERLPVQLPGAFEAAMAQRQMIARVQKAMEALPNSQREILECAYFEGMSHNEIARHTGLPLGTVKTRLRAALEILRRDLHP